jgi:hypothetical protein
MNSTAETPAAWAEQTAMEQPKDAVLARRCVQQTEVDSASRCWNRSGQANQGYPYIKVKGKRPAVRLLISQIEHRRLNPDSPYPSDMFVRATCNNQRCINPAHLYLKSQHDCGVDDLLPYVPEAKPKPHVEVIKVQKIMQRVTTLKQRFEAQWKKEGEHERWIGGRSHNAPILRRGKYKAAALDPIQMRYEGKVRPLGADEVLIHLCEHKDCAAVAHLKIVKKSEKARARAEIKFLRNKTRDPNGCETFTGKKRASEQQLVNIGSGRHMTARRFAYEIEHGRDAIPEGHVVRTHCGCENCVNPAHLYTAPKGDVARENVQKRESRRSEHATATM